MGAGGDFLSVYGCITISGDGVNHTELFNSLTAFTTDVLHHVSVCTWRMSLMAALNDLSSGSVRT
jgi:hypothetical protein